MFFFQPNKKCELQSHITLFLWYNPFWLKIFLDLSKNVQQWLKWKFIFFCVFLFLFKRSKKFRHQIYKAHIRHISLLSKTIFIWTHKIHILTDLRWFFTFTVVTLQRTKRFHDTDQLSDSQTKLNFEVSLKHCLQLRLGCNFTPHLSLRVKFILFYKISICLKFQWLKFFYFLSNFYFLPNLLFNYSTVITLTCRRFICDRWYSVKSSSPFDL